MEVLIQGILDGKNELFDLQGNNVVDTPAERSICRRIRVRKNGKYGFIDMNGNLVIPAEYDWADTFDRIKLYGKWYIATTVSIQQRKWLIDSNNQPISSTLDINNQHFIINDKLWVKQDKGYTLVNLKWETLLQTDYQDIVNDHSQQPQNIYLVKKQDYFGVIRICDNNREQVILPFKFESCKFWKLHGTRFLIQGTIKGKKGLFDLDGNNVIPCTYNKSDVIIAEYSFDCEKQYYTIYTIEEEYLLDENCLVIARINKRNDVSYFHFLMNQQRKQFRFKTINELLSYCKNIDEKTISYTDKEDIITYAYFFLEEILQKYAAQYDLRYTRFRFLNNRWQTRWGECEYWNRSINLNLSLLLQSERNIRKVILHELAHLKYPRHTKNFYEFLGKLLGTNTQEAKKKFGGKMTFLKEENWFAIINQKKKELFALAEQGIS